MKKPRLSIGIPTYNQGEYLREAIESVLNQTKKPYEFIISDNHCTDDVSISILKEYSKSVKIIKPPHHLSMMENWNFLCENLTGDYVSLISSDDFYEKKFVEEFYNIFNEKYSFYRFGFNSVDSNSNIIRPNFIKSVPKIQFFPCNFISQFNGPKASFSAFVIKRSLIKEHGGFDENLNLYADWMLWLKIAAFTPFVYSNKIVSNYRTSYRNNLFHDRFYLMLNDVEYIYNYINFSAKGKFEKIYYRLNYSLYLNKILFDLKDDQTFLKDKVIVLINNYKLLSLSKLKMSLLSILIRVYNYSLKFI